MSDIPKVKTLEWEEVKECADSVFNYWFFNDDEVEWARRSWEHLKKAGLTSYTCNAERCKAVIYFMALNDIYNDFLYTAWRASETTLFGDIAYDLNIRIEQSIEFARFDSSWFDKEDLVEMLTPEDADLVNLLGNLTYEARPEVFKVLKQGYGDDALLFLSLWRTKVSEEDESDDCVLSSVTPDKMETYEWLIGTRERFRRW